MKTTTLKNLRAARKTLNAKINLLENKTIKVGDFVHLKNEGRDIHGNYHPTSLHDCYYNDVGRIEYKVVEANRNTVTVIMVEGYDPKGHNAFIFDRKNVYLCKKPREEAGQIDEYFKDLIWKEWEKATGKHRHWDWRENNAPWGWKQY